MLILVDLMELSGFITNNRVKNRLWGFTSSPSSNVTKMLEGC
jgi:hypothetical protein